MIDPAVWTLVGEISIERYVLPWIYVWLTYLQVDYVHASYLKYHSPLRGGLPHLSAPQFWASMTKSILRVPRNPIRSLTM